MDEVIREMEIGEYVMSTMPEGYTPTTKTYKMCIRDSAWDAQSRFAAKLRHKCVQICLLITGSALLPDAGQPPAFSSVKK